MDRNFITQFSLSASPSQVFPLLCPVREHDWIPTWRAQIVHSHSGLAELDCVFITQSPSDGERTWVCTRFEPSDAIEYTAFSTLGYVMHLTIALEAQGEGGTNVSWSRRFIAVNGEGKAWIDAIPSPRMAEATGALAKLLEYYLVNGSMLRS
jgi:hypothetical protein